MISFLKTHRFLNKFMFFTFSLHLEMRNPPVLVKANSYSNQVFARDAKIVIDHIFYISYLFMKPDFFIYFSNFQTANFPLISLRYVNGKLVSFFTFSRFQRHFTPWKLMYSSDKSSWLGPVSPRGSGGRGVVYTKLFINQTLNVTTKRLYIHRNLCPKRPHLGPFPQHQTYSSIPSRAALSLRCCSPCGCKYPHRDQGKGGGSSNNRTLFLAPLASLAMRSPFLSSFCDVVLCAWVRWGPFRRCSGVGG